MNWELIGTALGGIVIGLGGWFAGKGRREVTSAENTAERDVVLLLRQEVQRLSERLTAMESREGRMIRHIYRLEGLMRAKGVEPPAFDLDSDTLRPDGASS